MPNQNQPAVQHGHRDAIRIVPLHVPPGRLIEAAAPATPPQLTYRNGPLLSNVEVFTVFWGTAWNGAQAALVKKVNDFLDSILTISATDIASSSQLKNYFDRFVPLSNYLYPLTIK
jgi:hypothetical protein